MEIEGSDKNAEHMSHVHHSVARHERRRLQPQQASRRLRYFEDELPVSVFRARIFVSPRNEAAAQVFSVSSIASTMRLGCSALRRSDTWLACGDTTRSLRSAVSPRAFRIGS